MPTNKRRDLLGADSSAPRLVHLSESRSDPAWDDFVASAPGGHHVQTSTWAEVKASLGWEAVRVAITDASGVVAGAQILARRVPVLGRVGYLDKGPLAPPDDPALIDLVLDAVDTAVRRRRIRLLIVQPPAGHSLLVERLGQRGFGASYVKAALGATVVVDLDRDLDEILAAMKRKTRYNIRKGLRSDLTIRTGEQADVAVFHRLLEETSRRQGFECTPLSSLEDMYRLMAPGGNLELLIAELDGKPLAGIINIAFADSVIYKRGAWSGLRGDLHPNETLHWEAMRRAKDRGFRYYDFDGIERAAAEAALADEPLPAKTLQSVNRFKLGFGGEVVLLPAAHSYLYDPLLRWGHDTVYPRLAGVRFVKRAVRRFRTH